MNRKPIDLLLIQLPLIYSNFEIKEKYIPLSLCYLFSQLAVMRPDVNTKIFHFPQTCLSDNGLLEKIIENKPQAIGFSCYVWNTERTLYFADKIKQQLPEVKIILGGPEISRDNPLVFNRAVDVLVFDEGEEAIVQIADCLTGINDYSNVANIAFRQNGGFSFTENKAFASIKNLDNIASPYNAKLLNELGEINYAFLEARRGCPYRCAYCFYGKGVKNTRSFSIDRVINEFITIKNLGSIRTIYFIDSCINSNPDFKQIMTEISKINTEPKIDIQIEARADLVDQVQVALMKEANVVTVEVGLQSYNKDALKEIGRHADFHKFEQGVQLLTENGIGVVIGSIHGLPLDDINSIKRTVDYVADNFPNADKHFYPLCVLPSTKIKGDAHKWELKYQEHPPYLILNNSFINSEQLNEAFVYSSRAITDAQNSLPLFTFYSGASNSNLREVGCDEVGDIRLISRLYLEDTGLAYKLVDSITAGEKRLNTANSLVLYFKTENQEPEKFIACINKLLIQLYKDNPYLVVSLIIEMPKFDEQTLKNMLNDVTRARGFLDYMNLYNNDFFAAKTREDSVNASLQLFKVGVELSLSNAIKKPITQIFFDDIGIESNDFTVIEKEQGYLVDLETNVVPDKEFFERLASEIELGKLVRFKNLIAQKIWDEVISKGVTNLPLDEHTLFVTEEGLKTAFFNKNEIVLDAAEWLISNKQL